ncbi:MAG TPA: LytTR family transcriptional regulator DNA-binding domain-containing protein [Candidatus Scybalomonas excrementigallinarum]|nr:LytTR family transcriptional regulator DNA-binding domain-containing protein [Candidatus Scybalomonas excrementigallinarum]
MRLRLEQNNEGTEEVVIRYETMIEKLKGFIGYIKQYTTELQGKKKGELYRIETKEIYYIESVDGKSFLYGEEEVYETDRTLKQLEKQLEALGFVRISKSCILNCRKLVRVKAEENHRMRVFLENEESLIVNRTYLGHLKEALKQLSEGR